jgi:hypothetical protein
MPNHINARAAASHIDQPPGKLARWRARGTGPPYYRFEGRVFYRPVDLDAWLESCRCVPGREAEPQSGNTDPTNIPALSAGVQRS